MLNLMRVIMRINHQRAMTQRLCALDHFLDKWMHNRRFSHTLITTFTLRCSCVVQWQERGDTNQMMSLKPFIPAFTRVWWTRRGIYCADIESRFAEQDILAQWTSGLWCCGGIHQLNSSRLKPAMDVSNALESHSSYFGIDGREAPSLKIQSWAGYGNKPWCQSMTAQVNSSCSHWMEWFTLIQSSTMMKRQTPPCLPWQLQFSH